MIKGAECINKTDDLLQQPLMQCAGNNNDDGEAAHNDYDDDDVYDGDFYDDYHYYDADFYDGGGSGSDDTWNRIRIRAHLND